MTTLILSSSSKKTISLYSIFLIYLFKKLNVKYNKLVLPIKKHKITLLTSPHVYKKSKEQFEICYFKTYFTIKSKFNIRILKYLILNKPKTLNLKLIFLEG